MRRILIVIGCAFTTILGIVVSSGAADAAVARCWTTPVLFPNPFPGPHVTTGPQPSFQQNAQLLANRGPLWAGVAFDANHGRDARYQLFVWKPGDKRVTAIATATQPNGVIMFRKFVVAGIGPNNVVVAGIETNREGVYRAYTWLHGKAAELRHPAGWVSVRPIGVTDTGVIFGKVVDSDGRFLLARWASRLTNPRVVHRFGRSDFLTAVAPNGAVVFDLAPTATDAVLPSGRTVQIVNHWGSPAGVGATGRAVMVGTDDNRIVQWSLADAGVDPVVATRVLATTLGYRLRPLAVNSRNDLILDGRYQTWLRTSQGRLAAFGNTAFTPALITDWGTVPVTGHDGQVRFVRCH